jgi:glycosyltransferase involved in cell wall biosynthesis
VSREEKVRFLKSLDVFSVPATSSEAFGLYVIEALAAGVPVVQPRAWAFPEIVGATGGGSLFEPGDSAIALADALEVFLRDPERARSLGAAGREVVRRDYSLRRMAASFVELAGVLGEKATAGALSKR